MEYKEFKTMLENIKDKTFEADKKINEKYMKIIKKYEAAYENGLICVTEKLLKQAEIINNCLNEIDSEDKYNNQLIRELLFEYAAEKNNKI